MHIWARVSPYEVEKGNCKMKTNDENDLGGSKEPSHGEDTGKNARTNRLIPLPDFINSDAFSLANAAIQSSRVYSEPSMMKSMQEISRRHQEIFNPPMLKAMREMIDRVERFSKLVPATPFDSPLTRNMQAQLSVGPARQAASRSSSLAGLSAHIVPTSPFAKSISKILGDSEWQRTLKTVSAAPEFNRWVSSLSDAVAKSNLQVDPQLTEVTSELINSSVIKDALESMSVSKIELFEELTRATIETSSHSANAPSASDVSEVEATNTNLDEKIDAPGNPTLRDTILAIFMFGLALFRWQDREIISYILNVIQFLRWVLNASGKRDQGSQERSRD